MGRFEQDLEFVYIDFSKLIYGLKYKAAHLNWSQL